MAGCPSSNADRSCLTQLYDTAPSLIMSRPPSPQEGDRTFSIPQMRTSRPRHGEACQIGERGWGSGWPRWSVFCDGTSAFPSLPQFLSLCSQTCWHSPGLCFPKRPCKKVIGAARLRFILAKAPPAEPTTVSPAASEDGSGGKWVF